MSDSVAPRTYLGWSLAATVLCFLPVGVVALVYGIRTGNAAAAGRSEDAARLSRSARRWLVATVVVGLALWLGLAGAVLLLGSFSS